jgi:hypothetical protein
MALYSLEGKWLMGPNFIRQVRAHACQRTEESRSIASIYRSATRCTAANSKMVES